MSEQERELITRMLKSSPGGVTRWIRGSWNALVVWALLMLGFVFAWKFIAWAARATVRVEIGWQSPAAVWIALVGILGCASYAVISSVRWVRGWSDTRADCRADLAGRQVVEEHYELTAAKRFQEPEHGSLIYFLRTADDKVFCLYDYESGDLGAGGEDPLTSDFQPRTQLLIVRAPKSEFVISQQFSGTALEVGPPTELSISPESWPESEAFCDIPWDELEQRLSRKKG